MFYAALFKAIIWLNIEIECLIVSNIKQGSVFFLSDLYELVIMVTILINISKYLNSTN